jgi:hypothetical protein
MSTIQPTVAAQLAKMNAAIDRKLVRIQRDLEDALDLTHAYGYETATEEERYAVQGKRTAIIDAMAKVGRALARDISSDVEMEKDTTKRLNTTFIPTEAR